MAADCKSAAPWSYGGSNPPLSTRFLLMRSHKLFVALAAFAGLALLAWFTLDATIDVGANKISLRAVVLVVLALFTVRTLVHAQREKYEAKSDSE